VIRAEHVLHGKTSMIYHDGKGVFTGLENPFEATRYHSLIVERKSLPSCFTLSAWTEEGEIMGLRHKDLAIEGVQFHPESILTTSGKALLKNFLQQHT
jgi:para-aminobenzoate synthetase component 2